MKTQQSTLCRLLDWDSAFFDIPIARVAGNHLTPDVASDIDRWCDENKVGCLYFLADVSDNITIGLAERKGYHLVDIRMTFERDHLFTSNAENTEAPPRVQVRQSSDEDIATLKAIARVSFVDSRFYQDGNFPKHSCDLLYETWIERSCHDFADMVLVATFEDRPCGFITLDLDHNTATAQIGLVGVSGEVQGRGIGTLLVQHACAEAQIHHMERVLVVTQGCNFAAQRLYQRCGFQTQNVSLWYHKWYRLSAR